MTRDFTVGEAAAQLHISDEQVRKLIRAEKLEGYPISTGTKRVEFRVTQLALDKFRSQSFKSTDIKPPAKPQLALPRNIQLGRSRVIKKAAKS